MSDTARWWTCPNCKGSWAILEDEELPPETMEHCCVCASPSLLFPGEIVRVARPDSEADGPYARSLVAEVVRNMNTFGDPEPVPQGPGKVAGTASMFTGQPEPAVSPAESKLFDQIRNPAEVSERPQTLSHNSVYPSPALPRAVRDGAPGHRGNPRVVLPPAGLRESALSGPRPASAPESHVPAGAIIDQLSQPQSPRKGTPAPFIQEAEFGRLTDNQPGNRDDAARSAIAKMHDYRADAANRVPQELETLKMLAETHGAKPPLSIAPPTVQPAIAIVPFSGASPAPSTSATAPAVTVVTVDTPVFDPAWADALQNRVLWLAGRNIQTAEIRLNPAELGSLQVQISVDDNSVDIAFRATQAATREALEIALPRLKDMLAENGMSLADASVSDQGIADQRDDSNRNMAADTDPSDENSTQAVSDLLPGRRTTKEPTGLVDTFV